MNSGLSQFKYHIIFDLDGTLGNTLPLCVAAFREAIEPLAGRVISDEEIIETFGPSEEGTIALLLPGNEDEGLKRYIDKYEQLHDNWPEPFAGILEILDYLKDENVFVGLVTGKGPQSTRVTLDKYNLLDYFDAVKTGESSGPVKVGRIEEVIKEHNLSREKILYIGDSPSDITACRDCRVRIGAAAWAQTAEIAKLKSMEPDFLFTSVDDFFSFLKNSRRNPELNDTD